MPKMAAFKHQKPRPTAGLFRRLRRLGGSLRGVKREN